MKCCVIYNHSTLLLSENVLNKKSIPHPQIFSKTSFAINFYLLTSNFQAHIPVPKIKLELK